MNARARRGLPRACHPVPHGPTQCHVGILSHHSGSEKHLEAFFGRKTGEDRQLGHFGSREGPAARTRSWCPQAVSTVDTPNILWVPIRQAGPGGLCRKRTALLDFRANPAPQSPRPPPALPENRPEEPPLARHVAPPGPPTPPSEAPRGVLSPRPLRPRAPGPLSAEPGQNPLPGGMRVRGGGRQARLERPPRWRGALRRGPGRKFYRVSLRAGYGDIWCGMKPGPPGNPPYDLFRATTTDTRVKTTGFRAA